MDFMTLSFGGWTSQEAAEQMGSDMLVSRTYYRAKTETLKELHTILNKEKTVKCLHDAYDFVNLSKRISIGFNVWSENVIELFRQNYYRKCNSKTKDKNEINSDIDSKQLHDPTRIFFNDINLCINCMLKIFAESPLSLIISSHISKQTHFSFSGIVSWLKFLYYPPMLKRLIQHRDENEKNKKMEYIQWIVWRIFVWCTQSEDQRVGGEKYKHWILNDDDIKYLLVRYTLIFMMGIQKGYLSRNKIVSFWIEELNEEYDKSYDLNYFCSMFKEFETFCESMDDLQLVYKLCMNLFLIGLQAKYPDFFEEELTENYQILVTNVVNGILLHHRKKMIKCHYCDKYKDNMKLCKGCKVIYYCCKTCQKKDWLNRHRLNCRGMKMIWWHKKWKPKKHVSWSKHFHLL